MGLIQSQAGFRLAPAYDNPSYLGVEEEWLLKAQHEPRGAIATQTTDEPVMKDYIIEWKRLGQMAVVESFKRRVQWNNLKHLILKSYICSERQQVMLRLCKRRYQELLEETK